MYDQRERDYLTVDEDASTTFTHYDYTFTEGAPVPDYRVDPANVSDRIVEEEVDAILVENKYVKATFTPDYGARLLSLIYKPTGQDLLYANPVGTPYGHGADSPFYANWLMVWGGIAPTFSESEHGKYWFLPWDYEVVETDDQVSIVMTKTDTINHRHDGRFRYGATGMQIEVAYTVYKDRPGVDMDVSLHNPADVAKEYEYWTLTTLAPRAPLHEGSPTMQFLAPLEKVRRESWSGWMANVEERVHPEAPPNSEQLVRHQPVLEGPVRAAVRRAVGWRVGPVLPAGHARAGGDQVVDRDVRSDDGPVQHHQRQRARCGSGRLRRRRHGERACLPVRHQQGRRLPGVAGRRRTGDVLARDVFRSDEYESAKLTADAGSASTVRLVLERVSGGQEVLLTAEESR